MDDTESVRVCFQMINLTLILQIGPTRVELPITQFSGIDGIATLPPDAPPAVSKINSSLRAEIQINQSDRILWSGFVHTNTSTTCIHFQLLVCSNQGDLLDWSSIQSFASIADGGYEALNSEAIGRLLNDILDFPDVTKSNAFVADKFGRIAIPCITHMERVATTDALILEVQDNNNLAKLSGELPILLAIELFEITYILVGFIDETEGNQAVFLLTSHIYRDKRSAGRRYLTPSIKYGDIEIVEVSDGGARLRINREIPYALGEDISINVKEIGNISFHVVHSKTQQKNIHDVGAVVAKTRESNNNWIRFLLSVQYPSLHFRKQDDHESYARFLEEMEFTTSNVAELTQMTKPMIEQEWSLIDSHCPEFGATVLAKDKNRIVGTFAVTRVGTNAWNSQVLVTTKEPAHLKHTRALFSWRTRFIIQQMNGDYNIGFFSRDKGFLDRFFRKFYLQDKDTAAHPIVWDEWLLYSHFLPKPLPKVPIDESGHIANTSPLSPLFTIVNVTDNHETSPRQIVIGNIRFLIGRPFQHICQYWTSAWTVEEFTQDIAKSCQSALGHQQVYAIRTKTPIDLQTTPLSESGKTIDDGWDVIWICHRSRLIRFLSNSLRSLELMHKKYGGQSVA